MKRGPRPYKNTSTRWTQELAYAVGLIATDGCLSIDGRHIDFTSKDRSLIVTFRKCLKLTNKIGRKTSGSTGQKNYFHIAFGDVQFYQWLHALGLTPHKSKTIEALRIPDQYFFEFLRGCWDGDGSLYAYWDKRWHSSYMYYLTFSSASILFLQWLHKTITRLTGIKGSIKLSTKSHQLAFAKSASRVLFRKMFPSENIPFLKRKFIKARRIFKKDARHSLQARVEELVDS